MSFTPQRSIFSDVLSQGNMTDPAVSTIPNMMALLVTCLKSLETKRGVNKRSMVSFNRTEPDHRNIDRTVADALAKRVRVLCWVMTCPDNHAKKARHVKATWGKRCNKLLFMSSKEDSSLPTIGMPVQEGRQFLWAKTKMAFKYIYDHHRNDADWFLKVDDDTYVVVENLRFLLSKYNTSDTLYFGRRLINSLSEGYMYGGSGYVLSRSALDRFVEQGLISPDLCRASDDGDEDVQMGICMGRLGVTGIDTQDNSGHSFFFPNSPQFHLNPITKEDDCCSQHAISFHEVHPNFMYLYDYFLYQFRAYGI